MGFAISGGQGHPKPYPTLTSKPPAMRTHTQIYTQIPIDLGTPTIDGGTLNP